MGVGDRRPHADGADRDPPADHQADPLDAAAAESRAGAEGDPAEVQARPAAHERGGHEVLQGEQGQPGRLVPPAPPPDPDLLRALLRAARTSRRRSSRTTRTRISAGSASFRTSPTTSTPTGRAGCCSSSTWAASSPRPSSCRRRWTSASAIIFLALPFVFIFFVINFPVGLMLYWVDDEPVDGRPGPRHAPAVPKPQPPPKRRRERRPRRSPAPEPATTAQADGRRRRDARPSRPGSGAAARPPAKKKGPQSRDGERAGEPAGGRRRRREPRARPSARPSGRRCASSSGASPASTRPAFGSRSSPRASAACSASGRCPARVIAGSTRRRTPATVAEPRSPGRLAAQAPRAPRARLRRARRAVPDRHLGGRRGASTATLDRRRSRPRDRQARPDDRRDPVPRQRVLWRGAERRAQGGRRRRGRLPRVAAAARSSDMADRAASRAVADRTARSRSSP